MGKRIVVAGILAGALIGAWFAYHQLFVPQPLYSVKFPGDTLADEALFSPDGKYLVLTGLFEIILLDAADGKQLNSWQTEAVIEAITFTADSREIVFYTQNANHLRVLTLDTGIIETIPLPEGYVVADLAYNGSGSILAVAGSPYTLIVEFPTHIISHTVPGASKVVGFNAVSGPLLIITPDDELVINLPSPPTNIQNFPDSHLNLLQATADGQILLLAAENGTIITLDDNTFLKRHQQPLPSAIDTDLKFRLVISPKGDLVAALQVDRLWLFRADNGEVVSQFEAKDHMIALGFTASGDQMAVYTHKGDEFTLSLWDVDEFLDRYGP